MKKFTAFMLIEILIFTLIRCKTTASQSANNNISSNIDAASIYSFPEPTIQIKVTHFLHNTETEFTIGPDIYDPKDTSVTPIIVWFYGLELKLCEKPDTTVKSEYYDFIVDGKSGFRYEIQNEQVFIIIHKKWYEVKNPSTPPIE